MDLTARDLNPVRLLELPVVTTKSTRSSVGVVYVSLFLVEEGGLV